MTTPEVRAAGNAAQRQRGLERARRVMRLHDGGMRGQQLADELGVSVTSLRSLLTRSRRRLGRPTPGRSGDSVRGQEPEEHGY